MRNRLAQLVIRLGSIGLCRLTLNGPDRTIRVTLAAILLATLAGGLEGEGDDR